MQIGCRRNWCSFGREGYGHYRRAWGGISAHGVAPTVSEVEQGTYGGPAAHRDLDLNEGDKSISQKNGGHRRQTLSQL